MKFKPGIKKTKEKNFEYSVVVGAKWFGLDISETISRDQRTLSRMRIRKDLYHYNSHHEEIAAVLCANL